MALFIAGLQGSPDDVAIHIQRVEKDSMQEPSHEISAELALSGSFGVVPLYLRLSRRAVLANVIRVCGSDGQLLIPTAFSTSACLRAGNKVVQIKYQEANAAKSSEHAFQLEHEAVLGGYFAGTVRKLLHFRNFALLTRLLEELTLVRGCP
jgi:hypothetical protein